MCLKKREFFIMKYLVISLFFFFLSESAVIATCVYNGRVYETGERRTGYVCEEDGSWKPVSSQ